MSYSTINRRYLQIFEGLIIEMRLLLNFSDISHFDDILYQKIMDAIKPLIILKLQKEQIQKSKKKKTKDLIERDEFSINLSFVSTRNYYFLLKRINKFIFPLEGKDESIFKNFTEDQVIIESDIDNSQSFTKPALLTTYKNTYFN
ncbi:uncharacterized protein T551_03655 [Pneumocystis jirovecii RU7]|uniref:Uncharacterized protein n=1 Tax=Pneumocystis jirovecii (strain RU7) TaxID=1408657 RepID=A0A0W4ZBP3_PNEJ7|nr:uncharacterized protein T551_03655 [Pneumocystis jirovecii RU7]KTW25819.1 hypothetical protein T551_03655 [Pneumocystis jirovecii RU7]